MSSTEVEIERRHTARWIAIVLGILMLVFVGVLATRKSAAQKQAESPLLGHPAPSLTGTSIFDGSAVDVNGLRGKFIVVNFIASWCVPCRQEHPELIKFSQRHLASGDAGIVGVIFDDTPGNVRRFFSELGGNWPVIADPGGRIALDYGVRGPPESFLIDRSGYVIAKIVGASTADGLDRLIAKAKAAGR